MAAALLMHRLNQRLRASDIAWTLRPDELDVLRAEWMFKSVRHASGILAREGLTPPATLLSNLLAPPPCPFAPATCSASPCPSRRQLVQFFVVLTDNFFLSRAGELE